MVVLLTLSDRTYVNFGGSLRRGETERERKWRTVVVNVYGTNVITRKHNEDEGGEELP